MADLDNDNDLEIIIGSAQNLSVIDLKYDITTSQDYWSTYQGDERRTGYYIFNGENIVIGDLNSDSLINVQDLVIIVNIIIGNINPTSNQLIAGDINNDGTLDVLDVVSLVNTILDN